MPLNTSIYARFAPKSVAQYDLEAYGVDNARQTNALNSLRLQAGQRAEQDAQRVLEEQTGMRNALAALGGGATDEQRVNALRGLGTQTGFAQADALEKSLVERQKTGAEVRNKDAGTAKTRGETVDATIKRYRGALDYIDTPAGAARWMQAQYDDPEIGAHMQSMGTLDQALQRIPQDPQAFAQWRQQVGLGMDTYVQRQGEAEQRRQTATRDAETGRHNKATEANAAGQLGVAQQNVRLRGAELAHSQSQPKGQFIQTPEGYMLADPRTGTVTPVMGPDGKPLQGKSADRALTEGQAKANLFGTRMQEADKIIGELAGKGVTAPSLAQQLTGGEGITGSIATAFASPQQQQVDQAQRDFINAVLRRESGAAISSSEFQNARKQYFVQPGDSKEVIAQKARNRSLAINGMLAEVPEGKRTAVSPANTSGGFKYLGTE